MGTCNSLEINNHLVKQVKFSSIRRAILGFIKEFSLNGSKCFYFFYRDNIHFSLSLKFVFYATLGLSFNKSI